MEGRVGMVARVFSEGPGLTGKGACASRGTQGCGQAQFRGWSRVPWARWGRIRRGE